MTSLFGFGRTKPGWSIGDPAPVLQATNQDGVIVDLSAAYARGPVLIYFYLRANTPVCTSHACRFRDGFEQLHENGVQIYGVSGDPKDRLRDFKTRQHLPFDLLTDPAGEIASAFRVPSFFGFAARRAFLVREGKIAWCGHASDSTAIFRLLESQPR